MNKFIAVVMYFLGVAFIFGALGFWWVGSRFYAEINTGGWLFIFITTILGIVLIVFGSRFWNKK